MRSVRLILALAALAACGAFIAACGGDGDDLRIDDSATATATPTSGAAIGEITRKEDNARIALRIGSKNFTEQDVLGEIYAKGLRAAGFQVGTSLNLGDQDALLKALKQGRIDAYPEYTGTALLAFFGKRATSLPKDPEAAYEQARAGFAAEQPPLMAYPPTPFTSSNEVAVTRATAAKYGLRKISDLARVAGQLTLYGSRECRTRLDCLLGLRQVYGLRFKSFVPVPIPQRHSVLTSGRADVSIVFTTDPQIKRSGEVLLEDDKGMFPPYNSTLVFRKDIADRAGPELGKTIDLLQQQLTDDNMQELNARVDLDKRSPAAVAREYLQETGLVAG
jgi:osmoprotectant transport system substrate-binding protein